MASSPGPRHLCLHHGRRRGAGNTIRPTLCGSCGVRWSGGSGSQSSEVEFVPVAATSAGQEHEGLPARSLYIGLTEPRYSSVEDCVENRRQREQREAVTIKRYQHAKVKANGT